MQTRPSTEIDALSTCGLCGDIWQPQDADGTVLLAACVNWQFLHYSSSSRSVRKSCFKFARHLQQDALAAAPAATEMEYIAPRQGDYYEQALAQ